MHLLNNVYSWVVLSVIVWVVSTTLTRARVFRPFRRWVKQRSDYFGEGVSCQYCLSHWVGFIVTLLYKPWFIVFDTDSAVLNFFGHAFAVIGLAALIARTIGKTPPDGVLHPDEQAEREAAVRDAMRIQAFLEQKEPAEWVYEEPEPKSTPITAEDREPERLLMLVK
jgi:hypothetical protein